MDPRETAVDKIQATWKNGQVVLDSPVDWPEGSRLLIEPEFSKESIGMREDEWSNTPEAVAAWLRWYDSLEPLVFTPAEEAALAEWRQRMKEHSIAHMHKGIAELFE